MQLTPEHDALAAAVRRFMEEAVNPYVDAWEEAELFPAHEVFKKAGELGLLGVTKPEKYGGLGLDYSYGAVVSQALGWADSGAIPMAMAVQTDMSTPALARFGSEELCREFLAPSITGEFVSAIGVSEAAAGSDVAGLKTRAEKRGDDYVINGSKMWITNGTHADWICLLANTGDGAPHKNKSLICVPLKTPGVSVARKLKKMGMKGSDTAELYFEDVRVPQRYRIGDEGMGFTYQMMQFQEERMAIALTALTQLQRSIYETIEYTRERKAFGKSILDNQVVHYRLAELQTELECLRALTWNAVETHVAGEDATKLASMAKLKAARLSRELNDACLQFWGGMGFMEETSVSRRFRDGRLGSIGGGADEVMLGIIAKYMQILPR
ncbi:MAG: acyl-CoA dehydrogenase family protein [Myxococcota bacterium]